MACGFLSPASTPQPNQYRGNPRLERFSHYNYKGSFMSGNSLNLEVRPCRKFPACPHRDRHPWRCCLFFVFSCKSESGSLQHMIGYCNHLVPPLDPFDASLGFPWILASNRLGLLGRLSHSHRVFLAVSHKAIRFSFGEPTLS